MNYYRTIVDTSGLSRAGFTMTLTGNFVSNATTDLANSDLKIFISRIASTTGGKTGATNPDFLHIHGSVYNFATFDDGTTNGQIRESSSSGGTVNCTFGGFDCQDGFYMRIEIANSAIKLSSVSVKFFLMFYELFHIANRGDCLQLSIRSSENRADAYLLSRSDIEPSLDDDPTDNEWSGSDRFSMKRTPKHGFIRISENGRWIIFKVSRHQIEVLNARLKAAVLEFANNVQSTNYHQSGTIPDCCSQHRL